MSRTAHRAREAARTRAKYDRSCRNHGSCPWCRSGRAHKHDRRAPFNPEVFA